MMDIGKNELKKILSMIELMTPIEFMIWYNKDNDKELYNKEVRNKNGSGIQQGVDT